MGSGNLYLMEQNSEGNKIYKEELDLFTSLGPMQRDIYLKHRIDDSYGALRFKVDRHKDELDHLIKLHFKTEVSLIELEKLQARFNGFSLLFKSYLFFSLILPIYYVYRSFK